jgi:hypothetical protein
VSEPKAGTRRTRTAKATSKAGTVRPGRAKKPARARASAGPRKTEEAATNQPRPELNFTSLKDIDLIKFFSELDRQTLGRLLALLGVGSAVAALLLGPARLAALYGGAKMSWEALQFVQAQLVKRKA